MLTLITGRGKSGKTTRLLEMVRDCPAQGMAQRILIVPEQLSHQTERLLSATCGDGFRTGFAQFIAAGLPKFWIREAEF